MDSLGGSRLGAAAGLNSSRAGGSEDRGRTPLVLELLMVLMCLAAVAGNVLVIVIVAATKTFHSVTSVLILNLAVSDLLVGVGVMPFVAVSVLNPGWVECNVLCLYVGYTSSVYCTASALTLAAIALDRYHSIMDCLRYGSRCTLLRTCAVVLWIWLQALVTSVPPLLGWSSISYVAPMYSCAVNWAISPSYTTFMAVLSYLIPAVLILFCYVNIIKVARSHARRIHSLEDSVQRSRTLHPTVSAGASCHQHSGIQQSPSRLIYHVSGQFVSHVSTDGESLIRSAVGDDAAEQSATASRRFFTFLAKSVAQGPQQSSQQHHHGVMRLFLVISAFFLCWTPYISVAIIQATETAITGQSTLVPPSVVSFSYWLVLLNSDVNPLLYALLSKCFQNALLGLGQKLRARLRSVVGRGREVRGGRDNDGNCDPCTLSTTHPGPPSSSESLTSDTSNYPSSIFTVTTDFRRHSEEQLCKTWHPENAPSPSLWQNVGGDRKTDFLQVPSRSQEGSRLPPSALTEEPQATFFYGQITVRVEHDVS